MPRHYIEALQHLRKLSNGSMHDVIPTRDLRSSASDSNIALIGKDVVIMGDTLLSITMRTLSDSLATIARLAIVVSGLYVPFVAILPP